MNKERRLITRRESTSAEATATGQKLREFFERIVVISMASRPDRRSRVIRVLARLGLELGKTPGVELFDAICPTEANGFPSAARRGSFLSHSTVAKQALRDKLNNILVIEDDAAFTPAMAQHGGRLVSQLAEIPWHIAFLGYLNITPPPGPPGWLPLEGERLGTHCYGLKREILPELTEYMHLVETREPGHPDGARFGADPTYVMFCAKTKHCITLMARPNLSVQGSIASDLSPKWFDRIPGLRESAALARRAKFAMAGY